MAATASEIENFLSGPLVKWLSTCVKKPETLQVYETYFDGSPIAEVLLLIDPEPSHPVPSISNLQGLSITAARVKIFHCIVCNLKTLYEEELKQIVVSVPDCVVLGKTPASQAALEQLKLLVLLLLGCAVQGPSKEVFIAKITQLSVEDQHDIVECIKRITNDQTIVLTLDWHEQTPQCLFSHIRNLTTERDRLVQQWVTDLGQESLMLESNQKSGSQGVESNHLAVELADWKAKMRKQRQELEEKSEFLAECKEELDHCQALLSKYKNQNSDLLVEARQAKAYRDEVDSMREKLERADRLEVEVQRYKERLADADFYKVRLNEIRADNKVLLETRDMLETQLARAKQRSDRVHDLEAELLAAKQAIAEIEMEKEAAKDRNQELIEENIQLQHLSRSVLQENNSYAMFVDSDVEELEENSGDNSLSEQLSKDAQAHALRLELENKRLLSTIDSLKEGDLRESSAQIAELEKEKNKSVLKCEQVEEKYENLTRQYAELEELFRDALTENRKLQDSIDTQKAISDRKTTELHNERTRSAELENNIEHVTKEKQRIQVLCDAIKKRADDSEKSLTETTEQLSVLQAQAGKVREYERKADGMAEKVAAVEKENANLTKEVAKLKTTLEAKDVTVDEVVEENSKREKEVQQLKEEILNLTSQLEKLQDTEKKSQELASLACMNSETISSLQKDLINEKIAGEKFKTNLDKLGLTAEQLENDICHIVEQMLANSDILEIVRDRVGEEIVSRKVGSGDVVKEKNVDAEKLVAELANLQVSNDALQNENATLEVNLATLSAQYGVIYSAQTTLQVINNQLVTEKDELVKKQQIQDSQHATLLLDQVTLRTLHEQLNLEYEEAKREHESFRKQARDLRSEIRSLKDKNSTLETKINELEMDKNILKGESRSLVVLRAEHSKLKDDFKSLFTTNDRLKKEYRSAQEELRALREESRDLNLGRTKMEGELTMSTDREASYQLENAKLLRECDMLCEMNHAFEADRRNLMNNVSQILTQYHSLLMYSIEDRQNFHLEEKQYVERVHQLCRQKEKLEEKIMEHYRRMNSATPKKKSFGATLVKRVRKAGSDIMNKVPRNRRSWHEDTTRMTQSQITLLNDGSGESNGNMSDNSVEDGNRSEPFKRNTVSGVVGGSLHGHKPRDEVALRRSSHRDSMSLRNSIADDQQTLPQDPDPALTLGSVGSRRTVYLPEEDQTSIPATGSSPVPPNPPMLVYNRISTVIGEPQRAAPVPPDEPQLPESGGSAATCEDKGGKSAKETAVWYEYGCV